MAIAKVNGPILPKYIVRIIINLPNGESSGVIPVDKPTVPKAEVVSNNSCIKKLVAVAKFLSTIVSKKVATTIHNKERTNIIADLWNMAFGTVLSKSVNSSLPRNIERMLDNKMLKVVVLIPPPVPPGDAPINIKTITKKSVVAESPLMDKVLNPAVLGVTARKKEFISFSPTVVNSDKTPLYSRRNIAPVPINKRQNVRDKTTFVCKFNFAKMSALSFLQNFILGISSKTTKPNPPKIISDETVNIVT